MNQAKTSATFSQSSYVREVLDDAENLLKFAAVTGLAVDEDSRNCVLNARAAFEAGLDERTVANLLIALTKLADVVAPVTAEGLRECTKRDIRRHPYRKVAICLSILVVVYSTVSFVTSSLATSIRNDITAANALAVKFTAEFETTASADMNEGGKAIPATTGFSSATFRSAESNAQRFPSHRAVAQAVPSVETLPSNLKTIDVASDLQQFAATIRDIDAHTRQLSRFTNLWSVVHNPQAIDIFSNIRSDPYELHKKFDLPFPLTNYASAVTERMRVYQDVRFLAQNVIDDVAFYYAAFSSCILPVMYALLGAAAFLLRNFERRVRTGTYTSSAADSTRFLVAAIGGAVVGLFSNFAGGGEFRVSPLALAFLVGYAVDVFYAFLEHVINSFTKAAIPSTTEKRSSMSKVRTTVSESNA